MISDVSLWYSYIQSTINLLLLIALAYGDFTKRSKVPLLYEKSQDSYKAIEKSLKYFINDYCNQNLILY